MLYKFNRAIKFGLIQITILFFLFFIFIFVIQLWHWYRYTIILPLDQIQHNLTWGQPVSINKQGFRERDFDPGYLNQADRFRVVILGDSLTWGVGLSAPQRYSNILEGLLKAEYPHKKITVLNFGVLGAWTCLERDTLRSIYKEIKPGLVVIGFCFNDLQEKHRERDYYFNKLGPFLTFLSRYKMTGPR